MRFSLLTLLLGSLTAGSALGVYLRCGVWHPVCGAVSVDQAKQWLPPDHNPARHLHLYLSPDRTRIIQPPYAGLKSSIFAYRPDGEPTVGAMLYTFPFDNVSFLDDNTVVINDETAPAYEQPRIRGIWRREYPEWWWGHFYRPEFWCLILFGALLLYSLLRRQRSQKS